MRVVRLLGHRILTVDTRLGRKVRTHFLTEATPLIRAKPKDLAKAGVERVGKIAGVSDGRPVTDDGQVLDVANVIWCTGWRPGFSWIDLPVLGDRQEPVHEKGVVTQEPGLYFIGLEFVYAATSATVTGVGRDAERVAKHIAERTPAHADVARDAAAA